MKFLIFNLSVITALAYLIIGQEQLSDIGRTISEKGSVSLEKAVTFLNTPNSKEIIEKTIGIKMETTPEKEIESILTVPTRKPELRNTGIKKIAPAQNNQSNQFIEVPPLPQPEPIRTLPETNAPKPAVSVAASSNTSRYQVPLKITEQKQAEFMSKKERRKELLKIARSAEALFIRRLTQ
jgi:hypothetical protein